MISLLRRFGASRAAAGRGNSRTRSDVPFSAPRRSYKSADIKRVPPFHRSFDASNPGSSNSHPNSMKTITTFVIRAIAFCIRYPRWVVAAAILIAVVSTWYAATHFTMTTDINQLLSGNSPSRQRELAFEKAFPQFDTIIAVVDAPTPELVQAATGALAAQLSQEKDLFRSIEEPQGGSFFGQNGLLFVPTEQLGQQTKMLNSGAAAHSSAGG